ncbi:nuclear transport factor 2 family protein [Limibaculum sp. FT325]|uniref:nuclear transport factor 2 family protein n=1 Tax=Thermohalobaculum sediminis TaxID=2939436 RepID=UPI0020C179E5|nr:nuclear transport factor 2 family protein [Limibaculum sediminis]MCL5776051.1 nuclear transport factor 2 family protein [Limibaculum sediminis]
MSDIETEAVIEANESFYRAMRGCDLRAMDAVWSRVRRVSCSHPGGPSLFGREAVMESWRGIFSRSRALAIEALEPHAIVAGQTAMILCREEIGRLRLIASNVFVRERDGWRMVNHQVAPIRDDAA